MLIDPRDSLLSSYDYELPEACIAQRPLEPRHAARLLMVEPEAGCRDRQVWDLLEELEPGDACDDAKTSKLLDLDHLLLHYRAHGPEGTYLRKGGFMSKI